MTLATLRMTVVTSTMTLATLGLTISAIYFVKVSDRRRMMARWKKILLSLARIVAGVPIVCLLGFGVLFLVFGRNAAREMRCAQRRALWGRSVLLGRILESTMVQEKPPTFVCGVGPAGVIAVSRSHGARAERWSSRRAQSGTAFFMGGEVLRDIRPGTSSRRWIRPRWACSSFPWAIPT